MSRSVSNRGIGSPRAWMLTLLLLFYPQISVADTKWPVTDQLLKRLTLNKLALPNSLIPHKNCIRASAKEANVPVAALVIILTNEGGRKGLKSKNNNGTDDHGLSQINDVRADELEALGLNLDLVRENNCVAIYAAAKLLEGEIKESDGDLVTAMGNWHYSKHGKYPKIHTRYIFKSLLNLANIIEHY